jgi:hypothetical protein
MLKQKMKKQNPRVLLLLAVLLIVQGCIDFTGDDLPSGDRDILIDSWKCTESDTYLKSAMAVYWVHIYEHPDDSTKILIYNFFDLDENVAATATVSGKNLTLPRQTLEGGFTFNGTGRVSQDAEKIDWTYFLDDGSGVEVEITAVYTRN